MTRPDALAALQERARVLLALLRLGGLPTPQEGHAREDARGVHLLWIWADGAGAAGVRVWADGAARADWQRPGEPPQGWTFDPEAPGLVLHRLREALGIPEPEAMR